MTINKPRNWNEVIQDLNKKDNPANKPLPAELPVLTELQILDICADCTMESKFSNEDCRYCHSKMETANRIERNFCQSLYSQALKEIQAQQELLKQVIATRNQFEEERDEAQILINKQRKVLHDLERHIDSLERRVAELEEENKNLREENELLKIQIRKLKRVKVFGPPEDAEG